MSCLSTVPMSPTAGGGARQWWRDGWSQRAYYLKGQKNEFFVSFRSGLENTRLFAIFFISYFEVTFFSLVSPCFFLCVEFASWGVRCEVGAGRQAGRRCCRRPWFACCVRGCCTKALQRAKT